MGFFQLANRKEKKLFVFLFSIKTTHFIYHSELDLRNKLFFHDLKQCKNSQKKL
jgi:hypothetical protein